MHSDFRNTHYCYYYYYCYIRYLRRSVAFCLLRGCKDLTLCHCSVVCRWLRTTTTHIVRQHSLSHIVSTHPANQNYATLYAAISSRILCFLLRQNNAAAQTDRRTDIRETGRDNSGLPVLSPVIASQVISFTRSSFCKLNIHWSVHRYSCPSMNSSTGRCMYLQRRTDGLQLCWTNRMRAHNVCIASVHRT